MKNKLNYTFNDDLTIRLKNPEFRKSWEASEVDYKLASQLIEKRLSRKMSQRDLARKLKTSQAVISRIETMQANPSLALLKRIAKTLNTSFTLQIK